MVSSATRRSRGRTNIAQRSFLDTVWLSVLKCAAHPVTFCVVVFLVLFVISEVVVTEGPFEYIDTLLKEELKSIKLTNTEKFILTLLEKFFNIIVLQKNKVTATLGYIVPVIVNPSKTKLIIFMTTLIIVIAFPSISVYAHLITALALFFYLNITRIDYRALISFIYVVGITVYLHVVVPAGGVKPNTVGRNGTNK
uniref:Uncharacterized protein n=1 Tax=Atrato Virga-like virus 7 TaxID=2689346 RepID=A0A6B9KLI4_9VIRU|nr:hypothetical protein [Atrato Virga-like virus 7]